jgi:hypothetical protein
MILQVNSGTFSCAALLAAYLKLRTRARDPPATQPKREKPHPDAERIRMN